MLTTLSPVSVFPEFLHGFPCMWEPREYQIEEKIVLIPVACQLGAQVVYFRLELGRHPDRELHLPALQGQSRPWELSGHGLSDPRYSTPPYIRPQNRLTLYRVVIHSVKTLRGFRREFDFRTRVRQPPAVRQWTN